MHTQVGIIGAGPAGLLLSHMLHRAGVESVVLERGNRHHAGTRLRAGGLEHGTVALLEAVGLGRRMREIGLIVKSTDFRFDGLGHRVDFMATGHSFIIYPQYEIVTDLLDAHASAVRTVMFDTAVTRIAGIDGPRPTIHTTANGAPAELSCDFIAGCDGFHACVAKRFRLRCAKCTKRTTRSAGSAFWLKWRRLRWGWLTAATSVASR